MRVRLAPLSALVLIISILVVAANVAASSPPSGSITVPTTAGQTASNTWTGTIPIGSNPSSDCNGIPGTLTDQHTIQVTVPANAYNTVNAQFRFSISWIPSNPTGREDASDEILTVLAPGGSEVGSSDTSSTTESVVANNLQAGTYTVIACGFVNAALQPYSGSLTITTTSVQASLPSAPAQGLQFSAAIPADNQRDEAEPLVHISRDGHIYSCGPTGFSNASDYAQVSTDGGDQFHLLGTPPRGQQGAGGGGDCAIATAPAVNSSGNYQYAYAGLGPLTGFVTSTSPNNGHSLATGGPFGNGVTDKGGGADRQWLAFIDDHTVLLSYNQQAPRNTVIQRSTDGGLTYGPISEIGAPNPRFPGPMQYDAARDMVFFAWDRGLADGTDGINLSILRHPNDPTSRWTMCRAAVAPANAAGFVVANTDSAGNMYIAYSEEANYHTYLVSLPFAGLDKCNQTVNQDPTSGQDGPTVNPGFSVPVQVDRDAVRTTVFPWLVAQGAPGRVAVTFYGTESDGNPNTGTFKGSWNVYVNESLNALSPTATFSQVKATTHPFHYDSICLNGLGCDLAVPPGDRSLADFFAIDYNRVTRKLQVVFDRGEKKPDEAVGHVANTMATTQIGGPSLGGGTINSNRPVVRTSSSDPRGDALSSYSLLAPLVAPPTPPTANEPAADFLNASIQPEVNLNTGQPVANGGFTVVMRVADLSTLSLATTMARTGSTQLMWVFRFVNGYQAAAATAYYNAAGFTFGYNNYTTASAPCEDIAGSNSGGDKCVVYPGNLAIQGRVDQARGIIALSVPRSYLRALSGSTGPGQRPAEVLATPGSRFYDAAAWSLGNVTPTQNIQSFLYPFDNTPAMDFLLPGGGGGGGGGGGTGCDDDVAAMSGPATAHPGDSITYTVTVQSGPNADNGCRFDDSMPGDMSFSSATGGGTYDAASHTVSWQQGAVPANTLTTYTVTGHVSTGATPVSVLVNSVSAAGLVFGPFAQAETTVLP